MMAAVKRGQVKTQNTPTGTIYFFPVDVYGQKRTWGQMEEMFQHQDREQLEYQNYAGAIADFIPPMEMSSSSGFCGNQPAGCIKDAAPAVVDHVAGLPSQQARLQKSVIVAEKMIKYVNSLGSVGPRVGLSLAEVRNCMEQAEQVTCDLSFAVEFGKPMDTNAEIDDGSAVKLIAKADKICSKLIEEVKIARPLVCKKEL